MNIKLSKGLPSPRFLKQFHKANAYCHFPFNIDRQMRKALWTLLAVPNKMPFFIHCKNFKKKLCFIIFFISPAPVGTIYMLSFCSFQLTVEEFFSSSWWDPFFLSFFVFFFFSMCAFSSVYVNVLNI